MRHGHRKRTPFQWPWRCGYVGLSREGGTLLIATPEASVTARNLHGSGKVRLGLGPTRDVVLIEGMAQPLAASEIPTDLGDAFAEKTGFDPRELTTPYLYFRITPVRIQAWREANELDGREVMRGGEWLAAPTASSGTSVATG